MIIHIISKSISVLSRHSNATEPYKYNFDAFLIVNIICVPKKDTGFFRCDQITCFIQWHLKPIGNIKKVWWRAGKIGSKATYIGDLKSISRSI